MKLTIGYGKNHLSLRNWNYMNITVDKLSEVSECVRKRLDISPNATDGTYTKDNGSLIHTFIDENDATLMEYTCLILENKT